MKKIHLVFNINRPYFGYGPFLLRRDVNNHNLDPSLHKDVAEFLSSPR